MWVKLDDNFPDHPKVDRLTDGAFRLHIAALCHAGKFLTNGLVPADRLDRLVPRYRRSQAAELIAAGLWEETTEGWVIHDFCKYNHTRDYWQDKRAKDAARLDAYRERKRAEQEAAS